MKKAIQQMIPEFLKNMIRNTSLYKNHQAKNYPAYLASNSKRLDICSAQFAHILHLSGVSSLSGKTCLEIGSGYVLSHAIVCYLLGAKRIIATDVFPHAAPEVLSLAATESIASIISDILSPFEKHELLRARLDKLLSIKKYDFSILNELGIEYIAPIDFAANKVNASVDFIYSNSVLEHVPKEDVVSVLNNLTGILDANGSMIHCIHLEDHKDIPHDPFQFLSISKDGYPRSSETSRGNRIRYSEWKKVFGDLKDVSTQYIYCHSRRDIHIPESIDSSVSFLDEEDLRVSHIGAYTYNNG